MEKKYGKTKDDSVGRHNNRRASGLSEHTVKTAANEHGTLIVVVIYKEDALVHIGVLKEDVN